jgi:hypothetical protein
VELNHSALTLHVGAAPRRLEDAQRLVAELVVIAKILVDESVTEWDHFARQLTGERASGGRQADFSSSLWYVQVREEPTAFLERLLPFPD